MSIRYQLFPYNQLLCHQGAYNIINRTGKEYFSDWDMDEFEKSVLAMDTTRYINNKAYQEAIGNGLVALDETMPFLKCGEKGQHYAYELFLSPPPHWASRGAPFFWTYVARQFTYDKLPMDEVEFVEKYKKIVIELNIPYGRDEYVYIDKFAAGGMSSGMVGGVFVKDALDVLRLRLKKYK